MKLVINSNINYKTPLSKLFQSLMDSHFKRFSDVVVVVGQCENDEEPKSAKISEITNLDSAEEITLIRVRLNNFDYTGYHALHLHAHHPLVKTDWYMYMLDTATVSDPKTFVNFIDSTMIGPDQILVPIHPHSNICAFGHKVIVNYGSNFGTELTKDEAIRLEFNAPIEKDVKSIVSFGSIILLPPRQLMGEDDVYGTGHPRVGFNYDHFGLTKWILWGRTGDLTGNLAKNEPFKEIPDEGLLF